MTDRSVIAYPAILHFSESRHYIREVSPANTMAYDTVTQMKLCGNAVDPNALARMDVAIAHFIHSHLLPFSLAQDPKLMKIIDEARKLGPGYKAPDRHDIAGKYLDALYVAHWKEQMKTSFRKLGSLASLCLVTAQPSRLSRL